jgi:hypothetical protein
MEAQIQMAKKENQKSSKKTSERLSLTRKSSTVKASVAVPAAHVVKPVAFNYRERIHVAIVAKDGAHQLEFALLGKFHHARLTLGNELNVVSFGWFYKIENDGNDGKAQCVVPKFQKGREVTYQSCGLFGADYRDSDSLLVFLCEDPGGEETSYLIEVGKTLNRRPGVIAVLISERQPGVQKDQNPLPVFSLTEAIEVVGSVKYNAGYLELMTPWLKNDKK